MVGTILAGLLATSSPLLSLAGPVRASLFSAALASLLSTVLILFILVFPAFALHPDFAHLKLFRRTTRALQTISGILLFVMGAQLLLVWPLPVAGPIPLRAQDLLNHLASPQVSYPVLPDVSLDAIALVVIGIVLTVATVVLYDHLAHRLGGGGTSASYSEGLAMMWGNVWYRLTGEGDPAWPRRPAVASGAQSRPEGRALVDELLFSSGLAAITLTFGLWAPQAGRSSLALMVLVLFQAGGIDTWLSAIDAAGAWGSAYTFGLWLGSLSLYWPTTLLVVLVISDVVTLSSTLSLDPQTVLAFQNTFAVWYRGALGAIMVLLAFAQSRRLASSPRLARTMHYGLATVASLVLLSFFLNALVPPQRSVSPLPFIVIAFIIVVVLILLFRPRADPTTAALRPHGAQLVASSSIALAPLLLSERIDPIYDSEQGYTELTVKNVGVSPQPLRLRIITVGSEDEVAFEALSKPHARVRGNLDFVITDLRTAIKIIASCLRAGGPSHCQYRIISVVATVPWDAVSLQYSPGVHSDKGFILDAGFLRAAIGCKTTQDDDHPCTQTPYRCRPASLDTVAFYAMNHQGDVSDVYLTEPYLSWLDRQTAKQRAIQVKSTRMVTYVLLARHRSQAPPAVSLNWRRTLCEAIAEGQVLAQQTRGILDHTKLHKLHRFWQTATASRVEILLEDIYLALCRSRFQLTLCGGDSKEYGLAIQDLQKNELLSPPDCSPNRWLHQHPDPGVGMRRALESTDPRVTDSDTYEKEHFFSKFCTSYDAKDDLDPVSPALKPYLHSVATVAIKDQEGELAKLLDALHPVAANKGMDLAFLASANIGDFVVVFLLDRAALPDLAAVQAAGVGTPLPTSASGEWIQTLRDEMHFTANQMLAFMVPIPHRPGGLLEVVRSVSPPDQDDGVNLEHVFSFPLSQEWALALLVSKPQAYSKLYRRLIGQPAQRDSILQPINARSDEVTLSRCFPVRQHLQQATFRMALMPGTNVTFKCDGLSTWTPTRGSIRSWEAEVGFDEVRLKIPTSLVWQIRLLGWLHRVIGLWEPAQLFLQARIPGLAGHAAYANKDRWWIVADDWPA